MTAMSLSFNDHDDRNWQQEKRDIPWWPPHGRCYDAIWQCSAGSKPPGYPCSNKARPTPPMAIITDRERKVVRNNSDQIAPQNCDCPSSEVFEHDFHKKVAIESGTKAAISCSNLVLPSSSVGLNSQGLIEKILRM